MFCWALLMRCAIAFIHYALSRYTVVWALRRGAESFKLPCYKFTCFIARVQSHLSKLQLYIYIYIYTRTSLCHWEKRGSIIKIELVLEMSLTITLKCDVGLCTAEGRLRTKGDSVEFSKKSRPTKNDIDESLWAVQRNSYWCSKRVLPSDQTD